MKKHKDILIIIGVLIGMFVWGKVFNRNELFIEKIGNKERVIHYSDGTTDTTIVNNPLNTILYLSQTDTARWAAEIASKVKYADTASMLNGYARTGNVSSLARASISAGTNITYNSSTGVISASGSAGVSSVSVSGGITNTGTSTNVALSLLPPVITITSRVTNTVFTPSTTRYTICTYGVTCQVTNPLLAGSSTADVYLEYLPAGTGTWLPAIRNGNSSSVGLAVAIQITNGQTGTLTGWVLPNSAVRIRSVLTGTASVTIVSQQEINIY